MLVEDGRVYITAEWIIKLTDHRIKVPSILFKKLDEKQRVWVEIDLKVVEG